MLHPTPQPLPVCPACGETNRTDLATGTYHRACIDRLLTRQRRERGAALIEYLMLLAFVAVLGIIGLRTIGPVAVGLFDVERLGLAPVPTEVLGTTLERPTPTTVTTECHHPRGMDHNHPICTERTS